jgi:DNA helicase-2/ATP-dependent DNA helicase PcrA
MMDFDDLLQSMAGLPWSPTVGVADEFRSRYRTFVVDEYQDVTPLQQRLLDAWLGERDDITVVGDANQTIYSFNGATPEHLLRLLVPVPGVDDSPTAP